MKRSNPLIWLILYPLLSLVISYVAIRELDATTSRTLAYVLSAITVMLPIIVLAVGIKKVFKLKQALGTVIATFLSSLFWVLVALVANRSLDTENIEISVGQSIVSIVSFTIIASICMLAVEQTKARLAKSKKHESG